MFVLAMSIFGIAAATMNPAVLIPDDGCQEMEVYHIVSFRNIESQAATTGNRQRSFNFTFHGKEFDKLVWKSQTDMDTPIRVITVSGEMQTGKATFLKYGISSVLSNANTTHSNINPYCFEFYSDDSLDTQYRATSKAGVHASPVVMWDNKPVVFVLIKEAGDNDNGQSQALNSIFAAISKALVYATKDRVTGSSTNSLATKAFIINKNFDDSFRSPIDFYILHHMRKPLKIKQNLFCVNKTGLDDRLHQNIQLCDTTFNVRKELNMTDIRISTSEDGEFADVVQHNAMEWSKYDMATLQATPLKKDIANWYVQAVSYMSEVLDRAVTHKPDERTWPLRTIRGLVEFWTTQLNEDESLDNRPLWKRIGELSCGQVIDKILTEERQTETIIRLYNNNRTSAAELNAEKQNLTHFVQKKMKESLNIMYENVATECKNDSDAALTHFFDFVFKTIENKVWNKTYLENDQRWNKTYVQNNQKWSQKHQKLQRDYAGLESERDALKDQISKYEMDAFIDKHWWKAALAGGLLLFICLLGLSKFRCQAQNTSSKSPQIVMVQTEGKKKVETA